MLPPPIDLQRARIAPSNTGGVGLLVSVVAAAYHGTDGGVAKAHFVRFFF
jgi:hypothetical protein